MFSKILVASDGSRCALHAVEAAAEIAKRFGSTVVALSVDDPATSTIPYIGPPEAAYVSELSVANAQDELKNALKKTAALLTRAGVKFAARSETGHPVDVIVRVAGEEHADLLVLGSRGMGGFERLLLGSVSDGVLHHAHCPVLIVR